MPQTERSVVAISKDRQWLVIESDESWAFLQGDGVRYRVDFYMARDDGQSADDILRDFLDGR